MNCYRIVFLGSVVCLASCGELELQIASTPEVTPAALSGRWEGVWRSSRQASGSGPLEIRIHEFAGLPVIDMEIDNPCLVPSDYDLVMSSGSIALQLAGETVMEARLLGEGRLDGSYSCALDDGAWHAEWVEALPALPDLSGAWQGRVYSHGEEAAPIEVALSQDIRAGRLTLCAEVEWPSALLSGLPMEGSVRFGVEQFEISLCTLPGVLPRIEVVGFGERQSEAVTAGVVQVHSLSHLPIASGLMQMMRRD